ncbi:MAG: hydrogenase expression/formation protein HypE [Planctomycetes bacterium]|nr:hydrogenase expression/formation protein HypE [Planctomycetota bacterium]
MAPTAGKAASDDHVVLAHGGGGELTRRLLAERIVPRLANDLLDPLGDSAVLPRPGGRVCLTTDAFVVQPLKFPGGDIGRLAVCGTVNDLAVSGAVPRALSLALVLEEGLPMATLDEVIDSIASTARQAGVVIATGDTKVVEHRGGGGMTITTAGLGELADGVDLQRPGDIRPGDAVIVSGRIAEHGLAVISARKGLSFQTEIRSDVAPLGGLVRAIVETGADVKFLRDPTRGGLAGVLADIAEATGLAVEVDEPAIPVSPACRHAAEMLGLDVLTVANEGKVVAVVAAEDAGKVLAACRSCELGRDAAVIGRVGSSAEVPIVELVTRSGGRRVVQRPYGEELPRIC